MKRVLITVSILAVAFLNVGWITHVSNWWLSGCEISDPTITTTGSYLAVGTGGFTMKAITMGVAFPDGYGDTVLFIDAPAKSYPCIGLSGTPAGPFANSYVTLDADADSVVFGMQVPSNAILTGDAADLQFLIDFASVDTTATVTFNVKIWQYGAGYDTAALVSDTISVATDTLTIRGWFGLSSLSTGIGAVSGVDVADRLVFEISPTSAWDSGTLYGVRLKYRAGLEATE
jgi:hypothetical protein